MGSRDVRLARLFFDIESNTKGFQQDLLYAERSAGRLARFIRDNPVAALGSLGAAAIAAGLKAAEMARAFDTAARGIAAIVPGATGQVEQLKRTVDGLATSKGLSVDEIFGGIAAIAKEGVGSVASLAARFDTLQRAADATGSSVAALAAPFDQILDVFQLPDAELEKVAAVLAQISQTNGVGFEDLLGAFQAAAPTIRSAGLSFDEGAAAIGRLAAQGLNAKQIGATLKEEVQRLGRDGMRSLTTGTIDATSAMDEFGKRAAVVEGGVDRMRQRLVELRDEGLRGWGQALNNEIIDPLFNLSLILTNIDVGRAFAKGGLAGAAGAIAGLTAPRRAPPAGTVRDPVTGDLVLSGTGAGGPGTGPTPEEAEAVKAAQARADAFAKELHATLFKATHGLGDDLQLVLDDYERQLTKVTARLSRADIDAARSMIRNLRAELARTLEPGLSTITTTGTALPIRKDTLDDQREQTAAIEKNLKKMKDEEEARARAESEAKRHLQDQAQAIERIGRGALQIAEAFGLIDANAAKALSSIVDIASNIRLAASGDLSGIIGLVGGLSGLAGSLFGSGKDPEAIRDREIRQQNTEALRELTESLSDQIIGQKAGKATTAVDALLSGTKGDFNFGATITAANAEKLLKPLGLSLADLQDILKEINPNLKLNASSTQDFIDSLHLVRQALDEINFRAFADSFAGQLALLQDQFDLMDLTNPIDQLQALEALGAKNSPIVKQTLDGLDLSTSAGRTEAEKRLLELFNRLGKDTKNGGLSSTELGSLSSSDLRDLIKQIEALIDQANGATAAVGSSTNFTAENRITETTGQRLAGIAESALAFERETAENTLGILAALTGGGGLVFPPVVPESLLASGAGAAAPSQVTVTFGPGAIEVQFLAPIVDAPAAGVQIVQVITDNLPRILGEVLSAQALRRGQPLQ